MEETERPCRSRIDSTGGDNATPFFEIKDCYSLVGPSGSDCRNDAAAIEKARFLAIGVSLDKPAADPTRRISVLNADRIEISILPVDSSPLNSGLPK
jgi:hypothetical protein